MLPCIAVQRITAPEDDWLGPRIQRLGESKRKWVAKPFRPHGAALGLQQHHRNPLSLHGDSTHSILASRHPHVTHSDCPHGLLLQRMCRCAHPDKNPPERKVVATQLFQGDPGVCSSGGPLISPPPTARPSDFHCCSPVPWLFPTHPLTVIAACCPQLSGAPMQSCQMTACGRITYR